MTGVSQNPGHHTSTSAKDLPCRPALARQRCALPYTVLRKSQCGGRHLLLPWKENGIIIKIFPTL
eukprot:537040-Amorphochlora_amoeboformis.AAC.2